MLNCYREKRAKTLPGTIMMRLCRKKHRKTVFGKSLTINNLQHITQQPCSLRIPKRAFPMYEKARLRLSYGTYGMPGKPVRSHKTCFSATRKSIDTPRARRMRVAGVWIIGLRFGLFERCRPVRWAFGYIVAVDAERHLP